MQDVLLQKNSEGYYDLVIEDGTIKGVDGMETAILVSLFTDARASAERVQDPLMRRGWIGNILSPNLERELGSVLWLADTARVNQDTLNFFKAEVKNAFQNMIDKKILSQLNVVSTIIDSKTIQVAIKFINSGDETERYSILWVATDGIGV